MFENILLKSGLEEFFEGFWYGISFSFSSKLAFILSVLMVIMQLTIALLIVGIILTVKKKKSGRVMLGVSVSIIAAFIIGGVVYFAPEPAEKITFQTPNGECTVSKDKLEQFHRSLSDLTGEYTDKHLNKNPELIYYILENGSDSLNSASVNGNIAVCEVLLKHGASYDNEFMLEKLQHKYAFEYFFKNNISGGSIKAVDIVKLMLENGAEVNYPDDKESPNALFSAVEWAAYDAMIDNEEAQIISLLAESGADTSAVNSEGQTPLEFFEEFIEGYDIYKGNAVKDIENTLR